METTYNTTDNVKDRNQKIKCFKFFIKATESAINSKVYYTIMWLDTNFEWNEGYGSFDFQIIKDYLKSFIVIDIKDNLNKIAMLYDDKYKHNEINFNIGISFKAAFKFLINGCSIARKNWNDKSIKIVKHHYKDLDDSNKVIAKEEEIIEMKENEHYKDWKPTQEDLDAKNWYVL